MITLRPYQTKAIDEVRDAVIKGCRSVVLVCPTGGGKTSQAAEIVRSAVSKGKRVLCIAHRSELIDQMFDRLVEFGLECGAISATSQRPPNPYHPVQVASIQTLLARDMRPEADIVIIDEAHHIVSDEWAVLAQHYSKAIIIGLTATPERADGKGLGAIFDRIVVAASVSELTALGHLVPMVIDRPSSRLKSGTIAQRPVDAYLTSARGRKSTIVFSSSIPAAKEHLEGFLEKGIRAELLTGKTDVGERQRIIADFKSGALPVLLNVGVLLEGFDAPATDCVILARSCGTVSMYLQICGRGLRPAPGKTDCLLIDLQGISHELGDPDIDRDYSLDGRGISRPGCFSADGQMLCRVCKCPIEPGEVCPDCGTEPKLMAPPKVTGDPLVRYATKRREGTDKRAATLAKWMKEGIDSGRRSGWAPTKFNAVYGAWPTDEVKQAARDVLRGMGYQT